MSYTSETPDGDGGGKPPVAVRTATGLAVAACVALFLWLDSLCSRGYVYAAEGALLAALGGGEFYRVVGGGSRRLSRRVLAAMCAVFFLLQWGAWAFPGWVDPWMLTGYMLALAAVGVLVAAVVQGRCEGGAEALAFTVAGLVYVPFLLGFLTPVRMQWGVSGILFVVATCKSSDSAAYFAGMWAGRHSLAPSVSPNKTVEGLAAGIIGSTTVAALLSATPWGILPVGLAAAYGAGAGAITALGDLGESVLKRDGGVDDSSRLIKHAGGVLDLVDGVLFAAPYSLAFFMVFAD